MSAPWGGGRSQRKLCAPPKVALVLHMVGVMEATLDYVMVCVVFEVLDGYVPEQMVVCPNNEIYPRLHLPTLPEHAICPTVPCLQDEEQEEVAGHIIHTCIR